MGHKVRQHTRGGAGRAGAAGPGGGGGGGEGGQNTPASELLSGRVQGLQQGAPEPEDQSSGQPGG